MIFSRVQKVQNNKPANRKVKVSHVLYFDKHKKADKHQTVLDGLPETDKQGQLVYMPAYGDSLIRHLSPETGKTSTVTSTVERQTKRNNNVEELDFAKNADQAPEPEPETTTCLPYLPRSVLYHEP